VFYPGGTGWSPNPALAPGVGFFFVPATDATTVTFVGNVPTGSLTRVIANDMAGRAGSEIIGSGNFVAVSALSSQSGSIGAVLAGYDVGAGDALYLWDPGTQDLNATIFPSYSGTAWDPDYAFAVAEGFFVVRSSATPTTWTETFNP
jgi:hypothetical protein